MAAFANPRTIVVHRTLLAILAADGGIVVAAWSVVDLAMGRERIYLRMGRRSDSAIDGIEGIEIRREKEIDY